MSREYKVMTLTAVESQARLLTEALNVQAGDGWALVQVLQDSRGPSYGLDLILVREEPPPHGWATLARIERLLEELVTLKRLGLS